MTMPFHFTFKKLLSSTCFREKSVKIIGVKNGQKAISLAQKEKAQIVALSSLEFAVRQIEKKLKAINCAQCNHELPK